MIAPFAQTPLSPIQRSRSTYPASENIRTTRVSLGVLGDGFVEAVADGTLVELARNQCRESHHKICGQVIYVPIVEAPGQTGVGRFGWKDQHVSLQLFSGDAYLNEMGITTRLFPDEVTKLCNSAPDDGLDDVDHFARFIRASKAPTRDSKLANSEQSQKGSKLFDKTGCAECHVRTLTTASAGTKINGGTHTVPEALGNKTFYPYSDFLLHDVGTGDGMVVPMVEHYGRKMYQITWRNFSAQSFHNAQNKLRTAPLWGVRFRNRLMHDGESTTLRDAILRHREEAYESAHRFERMSAADQQAILEFLSSL